MTFLEFLNALEKLAVLIYKNDSKLLTNYDRLEELYNYIGLNDAY